MNRRAYLSMLGTTAFAGCSASAGFAGEMAEFSSESANEFTIEQSLELEAGTYRYWLFDGDLPFSINYTGLVRAGSPVDFYVTTIKEFNYYRDEKRYQVLTDASVPNTTEARIRTTISSGEYVFCIDNTGAGEATDPSDCEVEIEFVANN